MAQTTLVPIGQTLGWQSAPDGQRVVIGFHPETGPDFALSFTQEGLMANITNGLSALSAFPTPKMTDREVCTIAPRWIEVAGAADDFVLTFFLDHGGSLAFSMNKESAERLSQLLAATLHPASTPPSSPGTH